MIKGFDIPTIKDVVISKKRVIHKVDFNLTIGQQEKISDDRKIVLTLPSIKYLLAQKNKLILISHLGMLKEDEKPQSMKVVGEHLQTFLPNYKVILIKDFRTTQDRQLLKNQKENEIIILENIRLFEGEKKNDKKFARSMAELADVYVTDAFAVSHREHASIVGIPQFLPSYAGLLMKKEVEMLSKVIKNPKKPVIAIISGKKISTKLPLIIKLMNIADHILVGGGIANTLIKAYGYSVGKSLVEPEVLDKAKKILRASHQGQTRLVLPNDVVVAKDTKAIRCEVKPITDVPEDMMILDIGPETASSYAKIIGTAATIIWNGPVGLFENPLFRKGTDSIYDAIVSNNHSVSVLGGSDTYIAILGKKNLNKITHISTGGGAMLKFIEDGTLPGLEALKKK